MSNLQNTTLPDWQRERLALLLDALDSVPMTNAERASLTRLSGGRPRRTSPQ